MRFITKVADVAEEEGHHPDIHIFYNKVRLELYTHAIKGLHENDFIIAAKIKNNIPQLTLKKNIKNKSKENITKQKEKHKIGKRRQN